MVESLREPPSRWRAWIAIGLTLAASAFIAWTWRDADVDRQKRVLTTAITVLGWMAATLLWMLTLSGWRWKTRLRCLLAFALLLGAGAGLFRFEGVSGDLVPILRLRQIGSTPETRDATPAAAETVPSPSRVIPPAHEYPQFLGPERNARLDGVKLVRDWARRPPRLVWRRPIGSGWSAFAVSGDAAFTQEQRGGSELVACVGLLDGKARWTHAEEQRYETALGGVGPRATPTLTQDRVVALGATGILLCLDRTTGALLWRHDITTEHNAKPPEWAYAGSPLVAEGLVFVAPGGKSGAVVAYRLADGTLAWASGEGSAGYASLSYAVLADAPSILQFKSSGLSGYDPATGKLLWKAPWKASNPSPAQPLVLSDDRVLVSSGYGVGSGLFRIEKDAAGALKAVALWETRALKSKFSCMIAVGEQVYGLDDGVLACIDISDGRRRWKTARIGHGQLLLAGDVLLVTAESGEVLLVEPNPDSFRELGRFQAVEGKLWACPAFPAPYLLVRSDLEAACWELGMGE